MAAEFLQLRKLTIFVGEDFFYKDRPFYKVMMDVAAEYKIAGCTAFRGLAGYGSRIRGKERRLMLSISDAINLPVIITMIDTEEQLQRIYPFLQENLTHGAAIVEDVEMLATDFIKKRFAKAVEDRNTPKLRN